MGRLARLTLVVGFCVVLLLISSVGADNPSVQNAVALQQATATPTEIPCPLGDPIASGWQLYMSDQPFLAGMSPPDEPPPREVFETGTRRVYAVFRTPCGQKVLPQYTLSIQVRDRSGGIQFDSGPMTVAKNQWGSAEWAVPADRSIPSGGSPYVTKLFWLDQAQPTHAAEVYWVVGVSVRFDRESYSGEEDEAGVTVIDYSAEPGQEFVTAHVSSETDPSPGGLEIMLQRSSIARGQFETINGIRFDDDCTQSAGSVLCVTHEDQLLAEYASVIDPNQMFTDEARWYRANFTPTPTWPPSPTPGPPTSTPTFGPSPTPTPVTPSPTPTPTEFPWATIVPLTVQPGQYDVGSVSSNAPDQNLLGTYAVFAGSYSARGQNKLYGAIHFDLKDVPAHAEITKAWLDIVGLDISHLNPQLGGEWTVKMVLDDTADGIWTGGGHPYFPTYRTLVQQQPTVIPVGTPMRPEDLHREVLNRFVFSEAARGLLEARLGAGEVAFRLDGPLMDEFQSFTWYSGYGSGDQDKKPVLFLEYKVFGATWTPSPTPLVSPTPTSTATPTATPTPTGTREPTSTSTATPVPGIAFHKPAYYTTSDVAIIEVVDPRQNLNPLAQDTIAVHVRSRTAPSQPGLRIPLTETSNNSGRFMGPLGFSTTGSDSLGRRIHVSNGDWIEAVFFDLPRAEAHWYAQAPTPTSTATATLTPTMTATPTPTPTPTVTPTPTLPAWVAFDREEYSPDYDMAVLTVLDPNADTDPEQMETVPVYVSSETDMRGIMIVVRETNTNTGIFTSAAAGRSVSFCWQCTESSQDEGVLKVSDGDLLTAFYSDPVHTDCCRDTARWYLSQTPATRTPTPTPTLPATPTSTPAQSPTATPASEGARFRVFLPTVLNNR
ncbi:MAG: hypothetical protein ACE5LU_17675 [Anaerolineae bacterium]